jgi:hypothetical protein
VRAVVSGSFHRHLTQMGREIAELKTLGVHILSPMSLNVIGREKDFMFIESDSVRSIKQVQSDHNRAIKSADFLWLVAPDGYVGVSAALEIGIAIERDIPIYCLTPITDTTLREFVKVVPDIKSALRR